MKNVLLLVSLAVSTAALGQGGAVPTPQENTQVSPTVLPSNIVQKGIAATYTDVYCAGWMSPKDVPNSSYVLAGEESPNTSRFYKNDSIYLAGSGWQEGQKVSIIRRAKDPNLFEIYDEQVKEMKKAGTLFYDMAQATVSFVLGNSAVAHVDFSCDAIVPGDLVVPFQERPLATFHPRPYEFKHFVALKGATKGRIILSKDFDVYLGEGMRKAYGSLGYINFVGTPVPRIDEAKKLVYLDIDIDEGKKFYVNIGSNQGLKPGDYLRVIRGYAMKDYDPADRESLASLDYEDDQLKEPRTEPKRFSEIPTRSLGEAVVLTTTPTTATAMVTYSVEDIRIGDRFEVMPADASGTGGSN